MLGYRATTAVRDHPIGVEKQVKGAFWVAKLVNLADEVVPPGRHVLYRPVCDCAVHQVAVQHTKAPWLGNIRETTGVDLDLPSFGPFRIAALLDKPGRKVLASHHPPDATETHDVDIVAVNGTPSASKPPAAAVIHPPLTIGTRRVDQERSTIRIGHAQRSPFHLVGGHSGVREGEM